MLDQVREVLERELPPEHAELVATYKVDALLHAREGGPWEAIHSAEKAIAIGTRVWNEDHPFVLNAEITLARAEGRIRHFDRALARFPRVVDQLEAAYGEHPMVAIAFHAWAELDLRTETHLGRAAEHARHAFELYRKTYPEHGAGFALTLFEVLVASRHWVEAGEVAEEVDSLVPQRSRQRMAATLADAFQGVGDHRAARPWLERAREMSSDETT
jgi:hypothetical protein